MRRHIAVKLLYGRRMSFATVRSISRPAWSRTTLRRSCVFKPCSGTTYIGVVQRGHPLAKGRITPSRYAAGRHISVSRQGPEKGPIEDALRTLGLERDVVTIVGGFATATALARASDPIAAVPERHRGILRAGMQSVSLPFVTPEFGCRCSGTLGWTTISRIARCADMSGRSARQSADADSPGKDVKQTPSRIVSFHGGDEGIRFLNGRV